MKYYPFNLGSKCQRHINLILVLLLNAGGVLHLISLLLDQHPSQLFQPFHPGLLLLLVVRGVGVVVLLRLLLLARTATAAHRLGDHGRVDLVLVRELGEALVGLTHCYAIFLFYLGG